ncbi:YfiR family protein, partial [Pseudomonas otitidis]
TISESADACSDGSLFCLDIENTRVSFAVNLDAVARSGAISSRWVRRE